ncbi:MAG: alpha/beta fold hydrolase, partial [Thermoguttaceae bacterium]|nr:alpha/beta fold hydrolase [Thermoguttaceae bacterium]
MRSLQYDEKQDASVNTLAHILEQIETEPTAELLAAFSELAYMEGRRQESRNPGMAAELYAASSLQAFNYLFDPRFAEARNSYDSRFHNVHLLYNSSLERLLRLLMNKEKNLRLRPGSGFYVQTDDRRWNVLCRLVTGTWLPDEIDSFTFAYDYNLVGVQHEYRQGGLGVPLVAKRKESEQTKLDAKYYPVGISFPVTAFLRPAESSDADSHCHAVLELYDPLVASSTMVGDVTVPLETDLTTPLVCFMSTPEAQLIPTLGLVRPDELLKTVPKQNDSTKSTRIIKGMYMMEPYDPHRIPVVLIHGLWSSPFPWMEMFNALRSDETIRKKYQFWFYFYPSGQPFWVSAAQLRDDLSEIRHTLDPQRQIASFDQMVLIGHSMGGLIARLQVMSAQDHFWSRVSTVPFD